MTTLVNDIDYVSILDETAYKPAYKFVEAKCFISNLLMDEDRHFTESFMSNEVKTHFNLSRDDLKNLKSWYKNEKREYDARKAINDLAIDDKYNGLYTAFMTSAIDQRVKINPHPDQIADFILYDHFIVTYKDTMFIHRDGFYRAEQETVTDVVTGVLSDICRGDNSNNIGKKVNDVITHIQTKTRVSAYPFNDYKNALPIENGVLIFDFENGKHELIEHDPAVYKFNYKIPVKYDKSGSDDSVLNMLCGYIDDPVDLIEILAQACMETMGHGPYKRAYLIHGPKNTGKTTFVELLERFAGVDMCADVSIELINQRFQITSLEGKLLNIHDDVGYFTMKDTGIFKTLTGRKTHEIEHKGKDKYNATITAVNVFTTNMPAKFDNSIKNDQAFWERFKFITFENVFKIDGGFHSRAFTDEAMTGLLNLVIDEILRIGKTGKLRKEVDWYETREKWMLAGNPLYQMVKEIMEPELLNIDSKASRGTAFLKEELLNTLQRWCLSNGMDPRTVPDSIKDLTGLVSACGWETDARQLFKGKDYEAHCYVIPYKWKNTPEALKYNVRVTEVQPYINVINTH